MSTLRAASMNSAARSISRQSGRRSTTREISRYGKCAKQQQQQQYCTGISMRNMWGRNGVLRKRTRNEYTKEIGNGIGNCNGRYINYLKGKVQVHNFAKPPFPNTKINTNTFGRQSLTSNSRRDSNSNIISASASANFNIVGFGNGNSNSNSNSKGRRLDQFQLFGNGHLTMPTGTAATTATRGCRTMPTPCTFQKSGSNTYWGANLTSVRNLSSSKSSSPYPYRDKAGRRIVRKVRVIRNNNNNIKSKSKTLSKSKKYSGYGSGITKGVTRATREVEKILSRIMLEQHPLPNLPTPVNTFPQPIQPPQNIKFEPLLEKGGKVEGAIKNTVKGKGAGEDATQSDFVHAAAASSEVSVNSSFSIIPKSSMGDRSTGLKSTAAAIEPATVSGTNATTTAVQSSSTSVASPAVAAPAAAAATTAANAAKASQLGIALPTLKSRWKLIQWLKSNAGTIILNLGSIATLTAFTRTDMLELRTLSIMGSVSSIIYFLSRPPPIPLPPIAWSLVFASTNAVMLYYIYEERKGVPKQLSSLQQDVYEEHFLPHCVTPRMFEKLLHKSKTIHLRRGDVLLQKGHVYHSVYLVASGATNAVTGNMSRRVTAASSRQGNKDALAGGDAGAWVGELAFLEYLNRRNAAASRASGSSSPRPPPPPISTHQPMATSTTKQGETTTAAAAAAVTTTSQESAKDAATKKSILTYIATEDSILYAWDHEELAKLLETSSELRSATTRAMTAAVVGKVVNLYISKADADTPSWKKWIQDYSSGSLSTSVTRTSATKPAVQPEVVSSTSTKSLMLDAAKSAMASASNAGATASSLASSATAAATAISASAVAAVEKEMEEAQLDNQNDNGNSTNNDNNAAEEVSEDDRQDVRISEVRVNITRE